MIFSESDSEPDATSVHMFHLNKKTSCKHSPATKKRPTDYDESIFPSPTRRNRQKKAPERYDGSPPPTPTSASKMRRHSNHDDSLPSPVIDLTGDPSDPDSDHSSDESFFSFF